MPMTKIKYVSLGSSCAAAMGIRNNDKHNETYPFDWIRTNTLIIYDILQNGVQSFLKFNNDLSDRDNVIVHMYSCWNDKYKHINPYGVHFTHYDNLSVNEIEVKFNRHFHRFFNLLNNSDQIIFFRSTEEYIFHKKSRENKDIYYTFLCKINDLLKNKFPNLNFKIINMEIENKHEDYGNIINENVDYNYKITDLCEGHKNPNLSSYRNSISNIIKQYVN